MIKITRLFIKSAGRTRKSKIKMADFKQQFDNDCKEAKRKGDKIRELALQRAYYSYLMNQPA